MADWNQWANPRIRLINDYLNEHLPQGHPLQLHEVMRYGVLGKGKRIRGLLVLASGLLVQAKIQHLLPVSASIELMHAYSLIHDDLPAMDNDSWRRGKPTCHIQYGEALALLAGDTLQTLAFEWILTHTDGIAISRLNMMTKILAQQAGSLGMGGGQAIDLLSTNHSLSLEELIDMHNRKTGALIQAALQLGVLCGEHSLSAAQSKALEQYGQTVGLGFQVVDDILDASQSSTQLGKTAGKDAATYKNTFVNLLGLTKAQEYAQTLHQKAQNLLNCLDIEAEPLRHLTHFIHHRQQ
jgi:farnesyl diphosphate synthase